MGLDYLNKKTWHTASIKNIAKVWEREQKELRKHQRQDEYNKKLMEEQHAHELKIAQVEAGLIPRSALDKMDWMYNPVLGQQQQQQNTEQYLLGKPVDMQNLPNQASQQQNQDPQDNSNKYQAIVTEDVTNKTCENFTLIHEDPLFKIMQEELKMREKILSNPLDMVHLLQDQMVLKQKMKADAKKKKIEKKEKKEKDRQEKKDRKKEKKLKKKAEKSERKDKKDKKREDSEENEKHKKNKDKDNGEDRRRHNNHKYEDEEEDNGRYSKKDQKHYRNDRSRSDSRKKSSKNDEKSRRKSKDDKKYTNNHSKDSAKRTPSKERKTHKRKNSLSSDSLSSQSSSKSPSSSRSRSRSSQNNKNNDKLRQKKPNNSRSRSSSSSSDKVQKAVRDSLYDEFLQKRVGNILVRDEDGHLRPDFGLMKRKFRNNLRPEEKLKMTEEEKKEMLTQMKQNAKSVAEERVKEFDDDYKDEVGNEDEKKLKDLHSKQQNPKFLASLQADIYGGSKDINALSSQIAKNKHKLARNVDSKNTFSKQY